MRKKFTAMQSKFLALNFEEDTFNVTRDASNSTPNVSIVQGEGGQPRIWGTNKTTFKHTAETIPYFSGRPADYPTWKAEMQNDVLPGESVERQIRIISLHLVTCNDVYLFCVKP